MLANDIHPSSRRRHAGRTGVVGRRAGHSAPRQLDAKESAPAVRHRATCPGDLIFSRNGDVLAA